jgi:hypothetical protein
MAPSPGEQITPTGVSPWRLLILLIPVLAVFWLWNTRYGPVREYRLYLTEDRKSAQLAWDQISEAWSEADVSSRFAGYPVRCEPDFTGIPQVTRVCTVDVKSLNGVPTLYITFMFAGSKLYRIATMIPWWSHGKGLQALQSTFGPPQASQEKARAGVRLHGWSLPGGAGVFYNRDRPRNPLEANSTQWVGASACLPNSCIQ